jgi:acyl-CoA thioester hydrolase
MYQYIHKHRVRYRECDPMGVVYHAHYIDYFEAARTEALREMGMPYRRLEDSGIIMPVVDVTVRYHRPAEYDDLLEIYTRFDGVPDFRLPIDYEVRREDDSTVFTSGRVTLCFVDRERNRPVRCPEQVRVIFERALAA